MNKMMKKNMIMGLVLFGLIGALMLVGSSTETRKGASAQATSSSLLPTNIRKAKYQIWEMQLWLNTGNSEDRLAGAEINLSYDANKLKLMGADGESGYEVVNKNQLATGAGSAVLKMITMGQEYGGAVKIARIKFVALTEGTSTVRVTSGKLMITGQNATWDLAALGSSEIVIAGSSGITTVVPSRMPSGYVRPTGTVTYIPKPTVSCATRPACLDQNPACMVMEPIGGWCLDLR